VSYVIRRQDHSLPSVSFIGDKMKPADVRLKIKQLKESLKLNKVLTKEYAKYLEKDYFERRVREQQEVIDEAQAKIDTITEKRNNIIFDIGRIEQYDKHRRKRLVYLQNIKKIMQFKELIAKIRKETADG